MLNRRNSTLSRLVLVFLLSVTSSHASAFIDGGVALGRRNANWNQDSKSSNISSDVLKVSAHLDPIPLVPVSFGLALYSESWKVTEADQSLTSLKSYSLVPEVTAWIPLDSLRPYARVGYSILSAYTGNAAVTVGTTRTTGTMALAGIGLHVGAGLEWNVPVIPLLSVFGELEYANERVRLAKDKIGDLDISAGYKPITLTSTAILIGAKLGI